jgi:hypothetical protein
MAGWFGTETRLPEVSPESGVASVTQQALPKIEPSEPVSSPVLPPLTAVRNPMTNLLRPQGTPSTPAPWEQQVDQILSSSGDTAQKAKQFVALISQLPAEGQVEAAEHAANLVSDDQYSDLAKILVDPKTPEAVTDVLLADLLDRPNTLKLPLLLQVARTANHPGQMEAHEDLVFYLDEDFGSDWPTWEQKLTAYLQENP